MTSKRGRPPYPDVLTPAEWRVVDGIREGRTNAEIADGLGVSVNTVRYHVSNILSKTGLDDRNSLAAWRGQPRRFRLAWPLPLSWLATAGGAVAAGMLVTWAIGALWNIGAADARTVSEFDTRASSDEFVRYNAGYLERSGLVDAGVLLENADGAPFEVMYRPGWAGVRAPALTWVTDSEIPGGTWGLGGRSMPTFTKMLADTRIHVRVTYLDLSDTSNFGQLVQYGGPGQIAFVPHNGVAMARVSVTDAESLRYPSVLDEDGRLWVALDQPVRGDEVVPYDTGELLDLSGMQVQADLLGGTDVEPGLTRIAPVFCQDSACVVTSPAMPGPLHAPFEGIISCGTSRGDADRMALVLSSEDVVLELIPMAPSQWSRDCDDFPARVTAGQALPFFANYWNLVAWDAAGNPLDVVMDQDWTLYLGDAQTTVSCPPCAPGS